MQSFPASRHILLGPTFSSAQDAINCELKQVEYNLRVIHTDVVLVALAAVGQGYALWRAVLKRGTNQPMRASSSKVHTYSEDQGFPRFCGTSPQNLATGPYPDPIQYSPQPYTPFMKHPF
jgi:hypothetical protein